MADTIIEMLCETGATKAFVTVVEGSGTPDVAGYDLTQIAGSLHKFTVPEAITGRVHILAKTSGDVVFGERYIDALTDTAETFDLAAGSDATLEKQNEILGKFSGDGAHQIQVTVQRSTDDTPVTGARVAIVGTSIEETTGTLGVVSLNVDDGTYSIRVLTPSGFESPDDESVTVSGDDETLTVSITPQAETSGVGWIG